MNRRRILVIVAIVGLTAIAGGFWWQQRASQDPQAAFELYGNVDVHQVELAFRVSGRIARLEVDEGTTVEPGMTIAELDKVPFETAVAAAEADVAQVRAQLSKTANGYRVEEIAQASANVRQREADLQNARTTLQRLRDLIASGLVTRQQVDDAEARGRVAEAQLTSAREQFNMVTRGSRKEDIAAQTAALAASQARLAQAQTALQDATLTAPSRGVVAVRAREVGAIVQAGQTVYALALNDPVYLRAYVPQPRLGRIKPGMEVQIAVDSVPGTWYAGTVGFISPEAEFTPKSVQTEQLRDDLVYRVRIVAQDRDNVFRQGMPVTVRIPEARQLTVAGAP